MTFYTQPFVAGAAQIVFEKGAVTGIMAGNTVHCLTVTWIICVIAGWVTKIVVVFVAADTNQITVPFPVHFKHSRSICTM